MSLGLASNICLLIIVFTKNTSRKQPTNETNLRFVTKWSILIFHDQKVYVFEMTQ